MSQVSVRVDVSVAPAVTKRLKVRPARDWFGRPGWEWVCPPCPGHPVRQHRGFHHQDTFTRFELPAQARAMDGARRHLWRYHGAG